MFQVNTVHIVSRSTTFTLVRKLRGLQPDLACFSKLFVLFSRTTNAALDLFLLAICSLLYAPSPSHNKLHSLDSVPSEGKQPLDLCSQTCGGGVQKRQVFCKQRLADGSILELPDTFCPSRTPDNQRPCGRQDCPPHWVTADWSQCSVTCGNGIQTLQAVCRKQGENGQFSIINSINCSMIARPIRIRSCFLRHCEGKGNIVWVFSGCSTCGRHGFQSRQVTCKHRRTGRTTRDHHCMWRPRPSSWQRCNMLSCGRVFPAAPDCVMMSNNCFPLCIPAEECRDSTRYCERVRQLELCPLQQFKSRCCHSCRKT
uniref:PLAC domain-containing protein n=1 Tax=Xiphophorus couchianus TaxID=32473 RepID=A0A3B5L7B1_9TELE